MTTSCYKQASMMYELNINKNFKRTTDTLAMTGDALFQEGQRSRNSHEMRLSTKVVMSFPISPRL